MTTPVIENNREPIHRVLIDAEIRFKGHKNVPLQQKLERDKKSYAVRFKRFARPNHRYEPYHGQSSILRLLE